MERKKGREGRGEGREGKRKGRKGTLVCLGGKGWKIKTNKNFFLQILYDFENVKP